MNKNSAIKCDVAVIGAGPAGLSFARSLAGIGLNIILVEKLPAKVLVEKLPAKVLAAPPMDGRDIALTHLSVEILKELDVWPLFPQVHRRTKEVAEKNYLRTLHFRRITDP